ncbi:MAG TPA: Cof-type HAD-IIB family hydrolase [Dietzia timorensis]|uniref:Cof-type HAD-IIB family hydrolase n=1 Tax=Dietzia timorensis TaxID=499555 RepID=A0A921F109_9ACTN|nr:HAD family hydrolase [Dietzia timorensis]HJE89742.1 Cof-type HAD-IIB family hydrolase [Dietzia timorensis]
MTALPGPTPADLLPDGTAIRLVVCDMDGTLLGADGRISLRTWEMIRAMRSAGITFVPASGRQYATLADLFADIHEGLTVIAENGTVVMRDGAEIAIEPLPAGVADNVVDVVRSLDSDCGAVVCTPKMAYTERDDEEFLREARRYYHALTTVSDLRDIPGEPVKVAIFTFGEAEKSVAPALVAAGIDSLADVVVSGHHWVDVMPPNVNKGVALERLQAALGVRRDETMVFGDYLNDLEMMDHAEASVAMSNGHSDVIQRSRYVAPRHDLDGVAQVLEHVLGPRLARR